MKHKNFFLYFISTALLLCGCSSEKTYVPKSILEEDIASVEREEVNYMQPIKIASDGDTVYFCDDGTGVVYRLDLNKKEAVVNCIDPTCSHNSDSCTAYVGLNFNNIKREGDQTYVLSEHSYRIGRNKKEEIGHGGYGEDSSKILFGDYIAYPIDGDIVVENLESGDKVRQFKDIVPYTQGNFYYDGALWYVTEDLELVRLDLESEEVLVVEDMGATRASVYRDNIYYILVDEATGMNNLIRFNPEDNTKTPIIDNVYYYNMKEETVFYSTWPDKDVYCARLDGTERELLMEKTDMLFWSFPEYEDLLVNIDDYYVYYIYDIETNTIDYDHPLSVSKGTYQ